jgi:hypothetical protein
MTLSARVLPIPEVAPMIRILLYPKDIAMSGACKQGIEISYLRLENYDLYTPTP